MCHHSPGDFFLFSICLCIHVPRYMCGSWVLAFHLVQTGSLVTAAAGCTVYPRRVRLSLDVGVVNLQVCVLHQASYLGHEA